MFESPIDLKDLRSSLDDARRTATGFATMFATQSTKARTEMTDRFEQSVSAVRSQALTVANLANAVATRAEGRIEPMVTMFVDRLPAPMDRFAADMTKQGKALRAKAHSMVVDALTDTPASTATVSTATKTVPAPVAPTARKTAAAKTTSKTTAKTTAKATAKTAATKTAKAAQTAKTAAVSTAKATVKKATVKNAARKASVTAWYSAHT